jgi:hypothetical protein
MDVTMRMGASRGYGSIHGCMSWMRPEHCDVTCMDASMLYWTQLNFAIFRPKSSLFCCFCHLYIYTYVLGSLCKLYSQYIGFHPMLRHSSILQFLDPYWAHFTAPASCMVSVYVHIYTGQPLHGDTAYILDSSSSRTSYWAFVSLVLAVPLVYIPTYWASAGCTAPYAGYQQLGFSV